MQSLTKGVVAIAVFTGVLALMAEARADPVDAWIVWDAGSNMPETLYTTWLATTEPADTTTPVPFDPATGAPVGDWVAVPTCVKVPDQPCQATLEQGAAYYCVQAVDDPWVSRCSIPFLSKSEPSVPPSVRVTQQP